MHSLSSGSTKESPRGSGMVGAAAGIALSVFGSVELAAQEHPSQLKPVRTIQQIRDADVRPNVGRVLETKKRPDIRTLSEDEIIKRFEDTMERLNDDEFAKRQKATSDLAEDVETLLMKVNPLPARVRAIIADGNLEQRSRSEPSIQFADKTADESDARLGIEGTYSAKDLLSRWERHLGLRIGVDPGLAEALKADVTVNADDSYNMTLSKICNAVGAIPSRKSLVPAPADTVTTASRLLLGIVSTAQDGTRTMRVLSEPGRSALVRSYLPNVKKTDSIDEGTTIVLPPSEPEPTTILAGIAYAPTTVIAPFDRPTHVGFQTFHPYAFQHGRDWDVSMDVAMRNGMPSNHLPCVEAAQPMFLTNAYDLTNAQGHILNLTKREPKPKMVLAEETTTETATNEAQPAEPRQFVQDPTGRVEVTLSTADGAPAGVRITAWSKYSDRQLDLPPFTPVPASSQPDR